MSQQNVAWCYRSGLIECGPANRVPDGAIIIAHGRKEIRRMRARARLAYNNKDLMVPGIPETDDSDKKLDALTAFVDWIRSAR